MKIFKSLFQGIRLFQTLEYHKNAILEPKQQITPDTLFLLLEVSKKIESTNEVVLGQLISEHFGFFRRLTKKRACVCCWL